VLVIDHHQARIFNSDQPGTKALMIQPPPTTDHFQHTLDSVDFSHSRDPHGQNTYFASLAQALKAADNLLIMGSGTGTGSCMHQFNSWVKSHHPDLSGQIIGTVAVNEHHLSDHQLLELARKFFNKKHLV
jgi:hypothetical protein